MDINPHIPHTRYLVASAANTDIMGDYPQAEDEIMASRGALDLLGIHEPVVGMEIPLSQKKQKTWKQELTVWLSARLEHRRG